MTRKDSIVATVLTLTFAAIAFVACDDGQATSKRFTITPRGGQFNHGPVTLTVPVGALSEPRSITIVVDPAAPAAGVVAKTVVSLQPDSLQFARDIDLTIWFAAEDLPTGANGDNTFLARREGTAWVAVAGRTDIGRWASGSIDRLGSYAVRTTAFVPPDLGLEASGADGGQDGARDLGLSEATATDAIGDQVPADQSSGDQQAEQPPSADQAMDLPSSDQASADQGLDSSLDAGPGAAG
jgi:hypothetical protein